jgi:hypothetical protein
VKLASVWIGVSALSLVACTSAGGSSGQTAGDDLDGASGSETDGAGALSMTGGDAGDATATGQGASSSGRSGSGGSSGGSGGSGAAAAGKAGADSFCVNLCDYEDKCVAGADASSCFGVCQMTEESSSTSPPTELLRADYVSALGACIAAGSCSEALQTVETDCAASVVSGGSGGAPLSATSAAAAFCHALMASPCGQPDAGVASCEGSVLLYSDTALDAAAACFSMSSCSAVDSCYAAAFTQQ